jgi:ribose transport system substrate-binding protein
MTVRRRSLTVLTAAVAAAALFGLAGCASASPGPSSSAGSGSGGGASSGSSDIAKFCGTKPAKVTFLKSSGGNTWVLQAAAEFKDEASKCKNITSANFAQQIGDQQKAIADITSAVAQGTNVIVIQADYGAPELPALRAATQAGVKVIPIIGTAGGKAGVDFTAAVLFDTDAIGKTWADFIHKQLPDGGNVAYIGGTPGNETSTYFYDSFKKAAASYPDLKIVGNQIQYANWDPVDNRKVMAGLLSQYGKIDAVVSDFNAPNIGVLQAYDSAGVARPVVASITPSNQLACDWNAKPYPWLTLGKTSSLPRLALRVGLAEYEGVKNTENTNVLPEPLEYTPDGTKPTCNTAYPQDADLSADLTPKQLKALFQK